MTSWNFNHKGKISFRVLAFFFFLLFSIMMIKGDVLANPLVICDTLLESDPDVFFNIFEIGGDWGDVVACTVNVDFSNWPDSVQKIEMKITWAPGDLELDSVDFSPWLQNHPNSSTQVGELNNNQGYVTFNVFDFDEFIGLEYLARLWFEIECFSPTDQSEVVFDRDCQNTFFESNNYLHRPYWLSDGAVGINVASHTMTPKRDSSIINDTLRIPVDFTSQLAATKGFASTWEFPKDSLDYLGVEKGPGLGYWVTLSDTANEQSNPATILIKTDDSIQASPSENTLFYILFKNTMHANYDSAIVTRKTDTLKICEGANSDLYSILSTPANATAKTFYQAKFKFHSAEDTTNAEDVDFPVMLSNNFTVLLRDSSEVSTFRINNTDWDYIIHDGYDNVSGTGWEWQQAPGSGDKKYYNDGNSAHDIGPSGNERDVSIMIVDCWRLPGTDTAYFRSDSNSTKLRDSASTVTIYVGSGIELEEVTFEVKTPYHGGGGGGCPFVYVWNGSEFKEDNTILAASEIYPGKPVADYYLLSKPLVPLNDEYRIQIREFENEVSYIDRLKLVAVDHNPDVRVAVTPEGKIFAYDKEFVPVSCVDQHGIDHVYEIKSKDGLYFVSEESGHLMLTYRIRSTGPPVLYDPPPDSGGFGTNGLPPPQKRAGVISNLTVEVQDIDGNWHNLGDVPPRFYPDRSLWMLDDKGVELGDEFKVKLSWDKYYAADELKYYILSEEEPIKIWNRPVSAVNSERGEILKEIFNTDGEYATLMPGQTIELSFPVKSSSQPDMVRDFVLQTTGYYISLAKPAVLPTSFALLNNYPNPFNATTVILYTLPQETDVKLEVYNILGQRVRVLVNEHQDAGYKKVIWDGRNDKGESVSSGIYFYKLQAQEYSNSKKMLLMK